MNHFLTQNGDLFGEEFFSSTRRLPAAARRRTEVHRVCAVGQEQRRNRKKEPPKTCEDCSYSIASDGHPERILTCCNKAGASDRLWIVDPDDSCKNFTREKELLAPELVQALTEGAKLIPLTQAKFAIVDAEDYEWLNQYKWHAKKHKNTSYAETQKNGKLIKMHRLITSAPPHLFVDHRDHNGLNNRRYNLRLCTNQQNVFNRRPRPGGTSKYKGVYWHKKTKKYTAAIKANGKRYYLGYFDDEIEAAVVYDIKAMELFGEFAYLNFPKLMRRYRKCKV